MKKKESLDMMHGVLAGKLILFTIPIAVSSMLQQLFNAADTAVVGHFATSDALAAVGTNGEIIALIVTLSADLSMGVRYLRLYFAGYPFLLLYDFGSAILRAQGDSRTPFLALALSGVINVLLNLFFVIVCGLGVAGVAIATGLSTAVSAFLVLSRIGAVRLRFQRKYLRTILAIGIPAAIQGAVFCFANIFVQASVNSLGMLGSACRINGGRHLPVPRHLDLRRFGTIQNPGKPVCLFSALLGTDHSSDRYRLCRPVPPSARREQPLHK